MTENLWNSVDDRALDARNFDEVRGHVSSLAGYWPGFASVLGLPPSTIREIEASHLQPAQCLDDAIERWLQEHYKVERFGLPSWKALVKAVEDRNGGRNPALAKKIAQEHPSNSSVSTSGGHAIQESRAYSGYQDEYVPMQPSPIGGNIYQHIHHNQNISSPTEKMDKRLPQAIEGPGKSNLQSLSSQLEEEQTYQSHSSKEEEHTNVRCPATEETMVEQISQQHILEPQQTYACTLDIEAQKSSKFARIKEIGLQKSYLYDGQEIKCLCYEPVVGWCDGNQVLLSSQIIEPIKRKRNDHFDSYQMCRHPHGIAAIINNKSFIPPIEINDSMDEWDLIQTFRHLGYKVELYQNLNACEITALFKNVQKQNHSTYDSFVCCILTRSDGQGNIYGCDNEKLNLDALTSNSLGGDKCRTLYGKPKMIFVNAQCISLDNQRRTEEDGTSVIPLELPTQADFFYGFTTIFREHDDDGSRKQDDDGSRKQDDDGSSLYNTTLCEALCKHGLYADLTSIHEMVQYAVAEACKQKGLKQITENSNRLTKKVYFADKHDAW